MRLLTYNIHKGIGGRDRRYQLERIIQVIHEAAPDIICLQEVDRHVRRSHFDDQPERLAQELGFDHRLYQLNVSLKHGGYGNLVLSRWPMTETHQISIRLKQKKPRGAQVALINSPSGKFLVLHTHLGLSERERSWQIRHLLEHHLVRPLLQYPTIFLGDTNDWRNQLLKQHFAAQSFRQISQPISRFRTFPAWLAMGSLDKVFVNKLIPQVTAHVVRTKLAKRASDHLPIVVDLELG
jgi:endonuclease/exonuclease/phosphatase family metal-dependent hydrolase